MKTTICTLLVGAMLFACSRSGHAQFLKKIKSHAADVVNNAMDKAIEGKDKQDKTAPVLSETKAKQQGLHIATPFDFIAGTQTIFQDNFSTDSIGLFPENWKTNASGTVVTVPGVSGQWFMLNNSATYKLDSLLSMPENFTVEFDVIAAADKADDVGSFYFGFSRNNSVTEYEMNTGIAGAVLYYMNEDEFKTNSKDLGKYHFGEYNLVNTLNKPFHISISVKGTHMKIYLDKTRILDTEMFLPDSRKYFFVSAPLNYDHNAKILIGNVKIAEM